MNLPTNTIDPMSGHREVITEKHLTREQRRAQERLKSEVEETYKALCDKFLDFFTNHDNPDSDEVIEKVKQLSGQWRIYCKRKNLISALFPAMDKYMDSLLNEYSESKTQPNEQESPQSI